MPDNSLVLLFDGACPFCRRECGWLHRRDRRGRLRMVDISEPAFDPSAYGLTRDAVEGRLHAIRPDGSVATGVDAIHEAYRAVGRGWITAPTRWPVLRRLFDALYRAFARNRVRLGRLFGRACDDSCRPPA